jgi:hypothetical protein
MDCRCEHGVVAPRIARRRAEEERGDMLFVAERRRSRRNPERDPQRAKRAIEHGSVTPCLYASMIGRSPSAGRMPWCFAS